jgi:3-oxoacyl-[acyl-carrier-protein] synthase-3
MDINSACSGFMYALTTAAHFIHGGTAKKILVIGSDIMSRTVNPNDPKTYPLFGDGAGAVLVVADPNTGEDARGFLGYTLGADGSGQDLIKIPAGGSREPFSETSLSNERNFFRMDGRSVFKWAVRMVVDSSLDVLAHAKLSPQDLDLLVLHQANARIVQAAATDLGIPMDRMFMNLDLLGNTSAASVPLVLNEAYQAGRLNPRDLVLMCGFGAGLAWGTAVMRW